MDFRDQDATENHAGEFRMHKEGGTLSCIPRRAMKRCLTQHIKNTSWALLFRSVEGKQGGFTGMIKWTPKKRDMEISKDEEFSISFESTTEQTVDQAQQFLWRYLIKDGRAEQTPEEAAFIQALFDSNQKVHRGAKLKQDSIAS